MSGLEFWWNAEQTLFEYRNAWKEEERVLRDRLEAVRALVENFDALDYRRKRAVSVYCVMDELRAALGDES